jgi:hypothetical protein
MTGGSHAFEERRRGDASLRGIARSRVRSDGAGSGAERRCHVGALSSGVCAGPKTCTRRSGLRHPDINRVPPTHL